MKTLLTNARLVLAKETVEAGSLLIEDGVIRAIEPESVNRADEVDLSAKTLMPGMIDLHCDALEKEVEPRPNVHFPLDFAAAQADKRNAAAGIATVFHALSFAHEELGVRNDEMAASVASHDDDSLERIETMRSIGADISEFPVNQGAAQAAQAAGMSTVFGAPNILRGKSQSGSMRAIDAIHAGVANCLCSDYAPAALIVSVFRIPEQSNLDLAGAVRLVSANPARAARLTDRGEIAEGKRADLIAVDSPGGLPQVARVWVQGVEAYRSVYDHG